MQQKQNREIHHGDYIIFYDRNNTKTLYIKRKPDKAHGLYIFVSSTESENIFVSVYKSMTPSLYLPQYFTITETDLDIHINHTRPTI